jgi:hypothetical protein
MIPKFFTHNNEDRIVFVEFIQNNGDILKPVLDEQIEDLEKEGEKFKHPHNQKQKLRDTIAFQEKRKQNKKVKTTYDYFINMNLGDDPMRGELLYDLDSDEIHDDGFMENKERRSQIREFEKWLNTKDVKKVLAKRKLRKSIKKHHIDKLKENLEVLSVRPMGALSEKDPGGLTYQKTLGKWEAMSMARHDKIKNSKLGGKKTNKRKTKNYRKTQSFK